MKIVDNLIVYSVIGDKLVGDYLIGDSVIGDKLVGDNLIDDSVIGDKLVADNVIGDNVIGDKSESCLQRHFPIELFRDHRPRRKRHSPGLNRSLLQKQGNRTTKENRTQQSVKTKEERWKL